jgi:hypothetical protein
MGKKANEVKERTCLACKGVVKTTSAGLKAHFKTCKGA